MRSNGALHDAESVRVDLGSIGGRVFVNNVSFGAYAEALLVPRYREAKALAIASVAPKYLDGQEGVRASVYTPEGLVDFPQLVLVSNNPYHTTSLRHLGRRFSLDSGQLGGIVVKLPGDSPPDPLPRIRRELRRQGSVGPSRAGIITWSSAGITVDGSCRRLAAGIDGESILVDLPVRCEIRPHALEPLLPRDRLGVPRDPAADRT